MRPFQLHEDEIQLISELRQLPQSEADAIRTTAHQLYRVRSRPQAQPLPGNVIPLTRATK